MKIFRTNAELSIRETLGTITQDRADWTAAIFHLSAFKAQNKYKELEKILFSFITDRLVEVEGYVFYCSDDDVLVIARRVPSSTFHAIGSDLSRHIPDTVRQVVAVPIVSAFGLINKWDAFIALTEDKIESWKKTGEAKAVVAMVQQPTSTTKGLTPSAQQRLLEIGMADRAQRKKPAVLIVEDDLVSLHLAKKALLGIFDVYTASNAIEARASYIAHVPDVVFLDIGLPDATGHDVLSDLLAMDSAAYVVMLSGNSFQENIIKSIRNGAKGFIGKPFARAKLLQYVSQSPHCGYLSSLTRVM